MTIKSTRENTQIRGKDGQVSLERDEMKFGELCVWAVLYEQYYRTDQVAYFTSSSVQYTWHIDPNTVVHASGCYILKDPLGTN